MLENETAIVIELAKTFIQRLIDHVPQWKEGYFRFERIVHGNTVATGVNGSVVIGRGKVRFLGEFGIDAGGMEEVAKGLFSAMQKESGVLLLVVNSQYEYNIHFDFSDPSRWEITKMDGETGIPRGIPKGY